MVPPRFVIATALLLGAVGFASACSSSSTNPASGGAGGADGGKPCSTNGDCDDANTCNGAESCQAGSCAPGADAADGTECSPPGVDAGGGDVKYACGKGECLLTCGDDADCDDADLCTGKETCGPSKTCQKGTPLSCDDGSACTDDTCEPESGCLNALIDEDGDGYAATTLGACGLDCDDTKADIHPDAADPCGDTVDSDCDGKTDDAAPDWYADCDGDGFAPASAQKQSSCSVPATAPSACADGKWIGKAPGPGTTDCADQSKDAYPRTTAEDSKAWQSTAIPGATTTVDFDYNCDGKEELRWTAKGVQKTGGCGLSGSGRYMYCSGASGWTGTTVPACGVSAEYTYCGKSGLLSCGRIIETKKQECR